jgi:hypothetical protein
VAVRRDEVPRIISTGLKRYFFPDWDERWKADRYLVSYRIGSVEEMFSFTPGEIEGAIGAASRCLIEQAQASSGRMILPELIIDAGRVGQNLVEYMVRRKHRLPKVLNPPA